jgi:hypothetical protein
MAKPVQVTLNKKIQKSVTRMFSKETTNARKIAEELGVPRHQVMLYLEEEGLARYSDGSYR